MNTYYLIVLLSLIWLLRTAKSNLFYLYLWQLKEYHFGRFIDHFRTDKGKRLFFNYLFFLKIILLIGALPLLFSFRYLGRAPLLTATTTIIFLVYLFEVSLLLKNLFQKTLKRPVFSKKMIFLSSLVFFLTAIYLSAVINSSDIFFFAFWLLLFDVLVPLVVSFSVLIVQPFVVLYRNKFVLEKAKEKMLKRKDLAVIGITGSYGKTSVKEFLSAMLSLKFNVLKTSNHQNSEMGIAHCILNDLKPEHQVFVVEMGAYGINGIKLLADMVKPKIGILTGINEQHLSLFGSQANIIKTKYELIEGLPKNGLGIFNGDNEYCLNLYKITDIPKKLYRLENIAQEITLQPDIWTENIKIEKNKVSFKLIEKGGESADITANVLGKQNIPNILGAAAVAREMGMSLDEIKKACLKITPGQGQMVFSKGMKELNILNATYSSNPDGVLADLDFLKIWPNKKIIIMPCIIELGENSKEAHKRIGRKIAEVCDLAIITTSERFKEIEESAVSSGMKQENIILIENPEKILIQLDIYSQKDDTVLLEGRVPSKVIKNLTIV